MIAGAKITDAMASTRSNPARMKIARASGESPLHVAQFVKIRLPTTLLCEIVSHAFTNENVASIPAIHHPLRDVDAYAGNVFALVCILHVMDRAAVDSHSHRQTWLRAQSVADLQGAFDRVL